MLVGERMRRKVITVKEDDSLQKAFNLMKKSAIRHLPVVRGEELVGIITDRDLRQAMVPVEVNEKGKEAYRLPKGALVEEHMTQNVLTVTPFTDIEVAARLIYMHKIGGLPVVEEGKLIGIITETDILGIFIEMMGILMASSRVDVVLGQSPEAFEEACRLIKTHGGHIISVGMSGHADKSKRIYYFRLELCDVQPIVEALSQAGYHVTSALE
ncbi:MAG: CBS domain-containing protein [Candidatus Tectomicrobia bacterium]|uniref:CBS domain-containing protein n=1 Tax=Tectimicrobiota bacterium TaxID=2528274 RepID=A0A932CPN4_UNCTE|nr:CBS domain-containing protein [Candidatus Tectomicrobia bacterium]